MNTAHQKISQQFSNAIELAKLYKVVIKDLIDKQPSLQSLTELQATEASLEKALNQNDNPHDEELRKITGYAKQIINNAIQNNDQNI